MLLPSIQEKLDGLDPGGTLAMERGDYGPCVITKPVILICDGATFWTDGNVPAVTVQSPGVVIKDAKMRGLDTASHVVISAAKDSHPLLQNIHIFGKAVGVEPEPAEWIVPEGIHTGEIPPNHAGFFVDLAVPQRSQIVCRISGVSMDPSALSPGTNTVKLRISDALPDSILIGEIEVIGSSLTRIIPFYARISASPSPKSSGDTLPLIEISAQEKERFQKGLAGSAPAGSQPSSTQKSPAAPQTGNQKTQPVPAVEPSPKQPARDSKPANKTQARAGKRKSTPAAQEDPLKLGGAFSESTDEVRTYRRLPVYILADCSGSMSGKPIESIKAGISALHSELMVDPQSIESVWMSVITFGKEACQIIALTELPDFRTPAFSTSNGSALGAALRIISKSLEEEKLMPRIQEKRDYNPIIFIYTSGGFTDDWTKAAAELRCLCHPKIIAIACGDATSSNQLLGLTDRVYEMRTTAPYDLSKFLWEDMNTLAAPQSRKLGSLFQSATDVKPQPNPLSPTQQATTSEQGSQKSEYNNQPHLSKLFSDTRD